ncbi:hypothetical protein ACFO4E_27035 [Nocardiopsis mangrovi]|uniref:Uncharacterized protein n=1 Tax=Nocardiopsis mangrovi TaxID=1179818 RepID=A0ABV9E797_9ACTN
MTDRRRTRLTGPVRFALITRAGVLVLAVRFGEAGTWMEGVWRDMRQDPGYPGAE